MQVCRQWAGGAADGLRGHRCGAGAGAGLLLAGGAGGRGDLLRWWCAGVVIVRAARSSGRAAADPAGRAGVRQAAGLEDGQKKKVRAAARGALLLWPSVCTGGAICCAGCVPVHIVGGGVFSPFRCRAAGAGTDPGATVPAGNVPAWHGLRWRCSIRCVFAPPPEGSDSPPNGIEL